MTTASIRQVAIWVAVGGVLGAMQCHGARRAAAPVLWDGPPARVEAAPVSVAHKAPRHHVIGI